MQVYIVTGMTGEWEDNQYWNVKGFKSKREADDFVTKLNNLCIQFGIADRFSIGWDAQKEIVEKMKNYDPHFQTDHITGTKYFVSSQKLTVII